MSAPDVTVEIAFSQVANPDAWVLGASPLPTTLGDATIDVWTDVTADAVSLSTTRGKQRELDAYGVGRCVVEFENKTRKYDPLNLAGPYTTGAGGTVAFEAVSESHTGTTGSTSQASFSWSHSGVTPRGVVVFIMGWISGEHVTSVTYGGVAMTAVTAAQNIGDARRVTAYFLGSGVPTGAQTVVVNRLNNAAELYAVAYSLTASTDTSVYVPGIVLLEDTAALSEQSISAGPTTDSSLRLVAVCSSLVTVPSVGANTTAGHSIDRGSSTAFSARETTAGTGSRPVGYTSASDDHAAVYLAVYENGGVTLVKPGKPIRVTAVDPATAISYYLFRGTIRDWPLNYSGPFNAIAQAQASDAIADLATSGVDVVTSAAPSGTAVAEVLADAGIGYLELDVGNETLQSMTFTGTAAQALRIIEQTEQGHLFSDSEGGISFRERHSLLTDTRSNTSQATFGTSTMPYESLDVSYSSDAIKNKARVTRQGGAQQEATDDASISAYGERLISLTGLAQADDAAALALAEYIVSFRSEPAVRFAALTCAAIRSAGVCTAAVSTRILDRLTVNFTAPGASSPTTRTVFVIGIEHKWSPPNVLRTTFRFIPTDSAELGWLLGVGELGDTTGPTNTVLTF